MSTPVETPDRRPLLYGVFALVILIAAAYLFWPRSPQPNSLVLTPESVRTETAVADASSPAGAGLAVADDRAALEAVDQGTATPGNDPGPVAETRIVENETPVAREAPKRTETVTKPVEQPKAKSGNSLSPESTGNWVLNVGAFSTKDNAQRRARELSAQGLSAHVQDVTQDDGKVVFRVRIGYFASDTKAKAYGEWLQRNHSLSSWPSQR